MRALIVFYSRTGMTRKAADTLSKILKADVEEIVDKKNRKGLFGYLRSGREAALRIPAWIDKPKNDASLYDTIIIGTPVWASNMSSPVRAYIEENLAKFKKVAFFCTMGGSGNQNIFYSMQELCGKKPVAVVTLRKREIKKDYYQHKLEGFAEEIVKAEGAVKDANQQEVKAQPRAETETRQKEKLQQGPKAKAKSKAKHKSQPKGKKKKPRSRPKSRKK